jgi:hypothetical protein
MQTNTSFQPLPDRPEKDAKELWRGIESLSAQLARLLQDWNQDTHVPLLICGDWGAGKTTLLHAMRGHLDAKRHPVIWFDAWRHEGADALLPALVREIWNATPKETRDSEQSRQRMLKAAHFAMQMSGRAVELAAKVAGLGGLAGLTKVVMDGAKDWDKGDGTVDPVEPPSTRLVRQLGRLVEQGWPTEPDTPPVQPIVFIDDLDRCSPDGALELLDQVRALLAAVEPHGGSTEHPRLHLRFVMAMDRTVLLKAVAAKYRDIDRYDANRFLEKMFPLAFSVPQPDFHDTLIILKSYLKLDQNAALRDHDMGALINALKPPVFANPRLMKRCVNKYRLVVDFEQRDRPEDARGAEADRALARWIAATERWPHLRRMIIDHGDRWWSELHAAQQDPTTPHRDRFAALFEQRGFGEWLGDHVFQSGRPDLLPYKGADERLRRWGL